jgi:starch synthase
VTTFPSNPDQFARDLAEKLSALLADPEKAKRFGEAGRKRVEETFAWTAIADQTIELYRELIRQAR